MLTRWVLGLRAKRGHRRVESFDAALDRWQRGDSLTWGELFAAWLKIPAAPKSRDVIRKVIRKVEWIG
jgi:hypothetical protein